MAGGERTERATPKHRGEARKRGQVARSPEVNTAAVLLAVVATLVVLGPSILTRFENVLSHGLGQAGDVSLATREGLPTVAAWALKEIALALAPVLAAALVAGLVASVAQVGFRITPKALQPSFAKLNPLKGVKRVFGKDGIVEALKSTVKVAIVGAVAFTAVWPRLDELAGLVGMPPEALLAELASQIAAIAWRVVAALAVLAAADFFWQRRRHERSIRMTKEEVKQEARQADLAPEVKGALRRRQVAMARKRMLAEVPTADVVVVNPTHFAVALRYDGSTPAPELIAKGADLVAAAIRKAAEDNGVPIVSNPPLARTLHREVEVGTMIPEELFAAVAEVLAFVYRTAGRRSRAERRRRALSA